MNGPAFLTVEIPFTPTASKNSRRPLLIKKKGGGTRMLFAPSKLATEHKTEIRALIAAEMRRRGMDLRPLAGKRVGFRLTWYPHTSSAIVEFFDQGALKKVPGARRDISNMDAVILDAANDLLYDDDSQVRHLDLVTVD